MMSSRRIQTRQQPRPHMLQLLLMMFIALTTLSSLPLHKSSVNAQPTSSEYYTNHIPVRYKVNQKQTECLYSRYEQGEYVTASVFIVEALKNGKPICNVLFEGPITTQTLDESNNNNNNNDRGRKMLGRTIRQGLLDEFPKNIRDNNPATSLNIHIKADWTHAGEEEDKLLLRQELERENNSKRKQQQQHKDDDPHHKPIFTYAAPKIVPFEMTHAIPVTGYYRVCAQAELQALVVEMDVRSSKMMGGVDEETGHVYSYVKRGLLDEEAAINGEKKKKSSSSGQLDSNTYQSSMEELSKILTNQISDADLEETKLQIKVLNTKTSEILTEIQTRMTRVRAHEQSARRNSANLAWSSKVETVLFAVITGFQVYTMRKWLLQNTLLGR